jgi:hypothetical protein
VIARPERKEPRVAQEGELRPILIELGKVRSKEIRRLREGRGELVGEVQDALTKVRQQMGAEAADRELVPVVMVYQKKRRRTRSSLPFPFPF